MNFKNIKLKRVVLFAGIFLSTSLILSASRRELDRIIARVNGEVIMQSELEKRVKPFIEEYPDLFAGEEAEEKTSEIKEEVLNRMIDEILLKNEAMERDIEVSREDIEAGIKEIRSQFNSESDFMDEMARQGFTDDTFRSDVEEQIKVMRLIEQEVQGKVSPPSEEEVRQYYEQNREQMVEPERVRARHILISTQEKTEEEAKNKIREIYNRAVENPDDFGEYAKEYSEGPTAPRGGDLGYFAREEMVPAFAEVAFELPIGEISEPVKTRFGYHIIKVLGRQAPEKKTFNEIKEQVSRHLYQLKMEEAYGEFLNTLREEANISVMLQED